VAITANPGVYLGNGFERHLCGGTLVSPTLFVSAAHCFFDALDPGVYGFDDPGFFAAITGRTRLSSDAGVETGISNYYFPVDGFDRPLYNPETEEWDVVVVELASSSPSPTIKVAGPDERALWEPGRSAYATGWGHTLEGGSGSDLLRGVEVDMISDSICGSSNGAGFVAQTMVCAGSLEGGRDACQGDSGGPLVAPTTAGDFRLVGVTSKGTGCARPGSPGIYGRLADDPMRSWVADTVQSIAGVDIVGSGARPVGGTASIGAVTISGPARIKRGRAYTYRATIVNFGDAEATGVRLRISGRGIRFNGLVGSVAPISSRTVSFRLRSFGVGRSRVSFSVVSNNAGSKTVRKTINVRR
jgi:secreted trypsin-like serine protease